MYTLRGILLLSMGWWSLVSEGFPRAVAGGSFVPMPYAQVFHTGLRSILHMLRTADNTLCLRPVPNETKPDVTFSGPQENKLLAFLHDHKITGSIFQRNMLLWRKGVIMGNFTGRFVRIGSQDLLRNMDPNHVCWKWLYRRGFYFFVHSLCSGDISAFPPNPLCFFIWSASQFSNFH